jgi:hypothetical protein
MLHAIKNGFRKGEKIRNYMNINKKPRDINGVLNVKILEWVKISNYSYFRYSVKNSMVRFQASSAAALS